MKLLAELLKEGKGSSDWQPLARLFVPQGHEDIIKAHGGFWHPNLKAWYFQGYTEDVPDELRRYMSFHDQRTSKERKKIPHGS